MLNIVSAVIKVFMIERTFIFKTSQKCKTALTSQLATLFLVRGPGGQDGEGVQGGEGGQVGPLAWCRYVLYCSFFCKSKVAVSQSVSQ